MEKVKSSKILHEKGWCRGIQTRTAGLELLLLLQFLFPIVLFFTISSHSGAKNDCPETVCNK